MSVSELEEMGFTHQAGRVFLYNDLLFTIPADKPMKEVVEMLLDKVYDLGHSAGFANGKNHLRLGIKQLLNLQ
jgi:hypothetical protein